MKSFVFVARAMGGALCASSVLLGPIATAPTRAGESSSSSATPDVIPAEAVQLFEYLKSGSYKTFRAQESATHPSAGPHTAIGLSVRVFMNDKLDQSLRDGADQHPQGAGVVKEMFTEKGVLRGWAVAVKTNADSSDGQGWYWYEVKSTTDNRRPVAAGNGVSLCTGCHVGGRDYILSQYPLQ